MHEDTTPNLTLRVGSAATIGILGQIGLLAIPANGNPLHILPAFLFIPPSVVPTLCVVWVLGRSGVLFPGTHGVPIALTLGSWHVTFFLCRLLGSIFGVRLEDWGMALMMSVVGTIPIAVAVWRLVRRWDWGCAFWMLGAGVAVGGAVTIVSEWALLMLVTTILWTAAIGFVAGLWLTKALALRG